MSITIATENGLPVKSTNPFPVTVAAGSAIIGKISIDQTTPGTTNGISVFDSTGNQMQIIPLQADGQSTGFNGMVVSALNYGYNGTSFDMRRNNNEVTILASAARTITTASADIVNYNSRGVTVTLDVTATGGVNTLTLTIDYKDSLSGKYINLLTGALVTGISTNTYRIYPGLIVAANVTANAVVPRIYRVTVTVGDATSATYSIASQHEL